MTESRAYYEDGQATIYHGDCREIMPALAASGIGAVIADPPYNVGKKYGRATNDSRDDYVEWTREWLTAAKEVAWKRIVFPGHGNLPMWLAHFAPSAIGCWLKEGGGGRSLLGVEGWEPYLYWCGDKGALGGNSVLWAKCETADLGHPTPKPVPLLSQLIKKLRVDSVLDPFLGSGTTLVAARHRGVRGIGIEIEERYCEIAAERLSQGTFNFGEAA